MAKMLWETLTDPGVYNRTALDQGLPPLRLISYNSILRGWSWYGKRACYWHYPSDWSPATIATPWTDHQPVTGLTHRDRTPFALKFTPMCSLELPVNLTLLNACLYVRIFYIRTLYKILYRLLYDPNWFLHHIHDLGWCYSNWKVLISIVAKKANSFV